MITHSDILFNLLKNRPHEVGCEVGVHTGQTVATLLRELPDIKKYYTVDPWESYKKYDGKPYRKPGHKQANTWEKAINLFFETTYPYRNKIIMMRSTSVQASKMIDNCSLDWVFVDANHEYEYIRENLRLWTPKVKNGGIISGHDYKNPKEKGKGWGITEAVDEFIPKNKLHIEDHCIWWFIKE